MCLIIASPTGDRIDPALIKEGARSNDDGIGFAWKQGSYVHWCKGFMDTDKAIEEIAKIPAGAPHAVHLRSATHGGVRPELTHPFPVTDSVGLNLQGRASTLLMHNGVYTSWQSDLKAAILSSGLKCPPGPWSDTRAVAFLVNVHGHQILNIIGDSSRWLVFTAAEEGMFMYGSWHKWNNLMFSNMSSNIAFPPGSGYAAASVSRPPMPPAVQGAGAGVTTVSAQRTITASASNTQSSTTAATGVATKAAVWKHFDEQGLFAGADRVGCGTCE